jgi:3-keto-L-gulonate-6-phosphate decarboxylase
MHPLSETVDVLSDTIVVDAGAVEFEMAVEFTVSVAWFTALVAEPLGA